MLRNILATLSFVIVSGAPLAQAGSMLDEFMSLQVGEFSSKTQAALDARYDVAVWHVAEIWPQESRSERWIYTESWLEGASQPYMQRVSRYTEQPDGTLIARRYVLPDAKAFTGAWKDPARFASLPRARLVELAGCDAIITRAGSGRFEGGTVGTRCANDYKGAAYVVSRAELSAAGMTNWDRGFDSSGALRWGPAAGPYRFTRSGATPSCNVPVRMLVYGEVTDRAKFGAYVRAILGSGLYERHGGYYEAATPPVDEFEGDVPAERAVVIARFPCLDAAQAFWRSDEYAQIRKLREGIARFEVIVLPVAQIPGYVEE